VFSQLNGLDEIINMTVLCIGHDMLLSFVCCQLPDAALSSLTHAIIVSGSVKICSN